MKDILLPIIKINKYAKDPEKINHTMFKFFLDRDTEIQPEKNNIFYTGFYLKYLIGYIYPAFDYSKYSCMANSCILSNSELNLNCYCYKKKQKDLYFAERLDFMEKNTCILYLNIVSSSNDENYILNITNS